MARLNIDNTNNTITYQDWVEFVALYISASPEVRKKARAAARPELADILRVIDSLLERKMKSNK